MRAIVATGKTSLVHLLGYIFLSNSAVVGITAAPVVSGESNEVMSRGYWSGICSHVLVASSSCRVFWNTAPALLLEIIKLAVLHKGMGSMLRGRLEQCVSNPLKLRSIILPHEDNSAG